jgi:hypothetical protein
MKQLTLTFFDDPPEEEGRYIVQVGKTLMFADYRRGRWWMSSGAGINGVTSWAAMPGEADMVEVEV